MSGRSLDELRALLFGEHAAERPDAPEPALLEYLIPLLPERLLPNAFANALHIWDPRLRERVWRALVQRIGQSADPITTLAASLPAHVRRLVLQQLTLDVPDDVLRATRSLDSEWDRRQMLMDLIPALPADRLANRLDHLLDDLDSVIPNPYYRSEVLAAIARRLPARRSEILEEALHTIIATERGMQRETALESIFLTLAESKLTGLAMYTIAALEEEHQRAGLWALLASQLSDAELTQALSIVAGYTDNENRVVATLNLIAHAPPALRHEALDALLAEAQSISDRNERTSALARLAPHLARAGRGGDSLTAMRGMRRGYADFGRVLAQVAPHLDVPEMDEALELAGQLPRSAPRFEAALSLLPRLIQLGQIALATSLAEAWQGEQQAQLLIEMLPEAPQSEQPRLFEGAMEALDELADETNRSHHVVELAGRLNELGYPELAMRAARETRNEAQGARAFLRLLPTLPPPLRDEALGQARYLYPAIPDARERTRTLGRAAGDLTGAEAHEVFEWVRESLLSLSGEWERANAAAELLENLPTGTYHQIMDSMASTIDPQVLAADGITTDRLSELLDESPPDQAETLLSHTLERMAERYQGDEADMASVPTTLAAEEIVDLLDRQEVLVSRHRMEEEIEEEEEVDFLSEDEDFLIEELIDEEVTYVEEEEKGRERIVNTGFAPDAVPQSPLTPDTPLIPDSKYWFWLEVGEPIADSIETRPTALLPVEHLPEDARLKVAIFSFDGEIEITPNQDVGELQLAGSGQVRVTRQPPDSNALPDALIDRRLFFPVRTPATEGVFRLRCNIYYEQVLIQSRLIQAHVATDGLPVADALQSNLDYTLTHTLEPRRLSQMAPHGLSVMMNENNDGTHGFHFFGGAGFRGSASIDAHRLQNLIDTERRVLRKVSWGTEEEWKPGNQYRYKSPPSRDFMRQDILDLAAAGYSLYSNLIDAFTGGYDASEDLAELMREPNRVQIAFKQSARHYVPAALFYDHALDSNLTRCTLCPAFEEALHGPAPLEESACFQGQCPSRDDVHVFCPSGFWGYRHAVGLPLSIDQAPDLLPQITYQDRPRFRSGVWTGEDFQRRIEHENVLKVLPPGVDWQSESEREAILAMLKTTPPHVVYFYCHGGCKDDGTPYLKFGSSAQPGYLTGPNLRARRIRWGRPIGAPRPLVFINGCHTTALEPETAIDFVSDFVQVAAASGVVGTEISVFEPLACAFAEHFMRLWLAGTPLGEAIRLTRLALLKQGNPLGLVYVPFAATDLSLVPLASE